MQPCDPAIMRSFFVSRSLGEGWQSFKTAGPQDCKTSRHYQLQYCIIHRQPRAHCCHRVVARCKPETGESFSGPEPEEHSVIWHSDLLYGNEETRYIHFNEIGVQTEWGNIHLVSFNCLWLSVPGYFMLFPRLNDLLQYSAIP